MDKHLLDAGNHRHGGYTGAGSAADAPLDTVTAVDHNSLVTAHILTMRNNMDGQSVDEPLTTISTSGAHHAEVQAFLVKYFSSGTAKPVDEPLDTITTKDRFALVTIHGEEYIITDIRMRMLQPRELFNAQGFPETKEPLIPLTSLHSSSFHLRSRMLSLYICISSPFSAYTAFKCLVIQMNVSNSTV